LVSGAGGTAGIDVSAFLDLTDVDPDSYVGAGGQQVVVNAIETGLEFSTLNIIDDTTPELGGNLDVGAFELVSSTDSTLSFTGSTSSVVKIITGTSGSLAAVSLYDTDGISLKSQLIYIDSQDKVRLDNETANALEIDGLDWPQADGVNTQVITTDGNGVLSFQTVNHANISNTGTYTHTAIDTHIDDATIHYTQASISITESQISDLQAYLLNITGESIGDLSDVTNTTPADKQVLIYDGVTDNKYENRLLVEADISDLQAYLTTEANDLTVSVTWANVPDANITETSVTQHEAALTLTESQISDLQSYMLQVINDTNPQLGGALETQNNDIIIQNSSLTEVGRLGVLASDDGIAIARTSNGVYDANDGGVSAQAGVVALHGGVANVQTLAGTGNRQVYVNSEGSFYDVVPAEPAWTESDTDIGDYALNTLGAWVEMTGLVISVPSTVDIGAPVQITANLHIVNNSANRGGTIDVGVGKNGVDPTFNGANKVIVGDMDSVIPVSVTTTSHGGLTSGDTLSIFARRATEEHSQFAPEMHGSTGAEHELIVSTASAGGGVTDHTLLTNIGTNTHDQIDTHIAKPLVNSDIAADAGSDRIVNMVSLTQAEYDLLTPVATTFYVIVG
ncbi:MAG: hypothetical protein DRQ56_04215, partial [Gammaproteobacteria bacterium]